MSESSITKSIGELLDARDAWWIKTHGSGYGRNGVPDIVGVYRGAAIAFEIKDGNGRVAKLQEHELALFGAAGGRASVVRSRSDAQRILDAVDYELDCYQPPFGVKRATG